MRTRPTTATILNVLAQTVQPGDAIPLLRRALALDRKHFGCGASGSGSVANELLAASLLAVGKAAQRSGSRRREGLSIIWRASSVRIIRARRTRRVRWLRC